MNEPSEPESDGAVHQEFLTHVRIVGLQVAQAQAEVYVVCSAKFAPELQGQVGVGEPVDGLEIGGAS